MKKDKLNEKQFIEYLDRLLAGQEITLGADISPEVRSALQHARKMLAFRQEPSPEFRDELRNKLLRRIYEKQAAPRETIRAFPLRPVLVGLASTVAVVLLAFVGVVFFGGRGAPSAPVTTSIPSATQYSIKLPANIVPQGVNFTAKTQLSDAAGQAQVYKIKSSDITAASVTALGRQLGFTGRASLSDDGTRYIMTAGSGDEEKQLAVWTASGAVEYGYVSPGKLYPSQPPSLPSQSQAETIAYDFLQQADLLPPDYLSLAKVEKDTTVAAGGGYSVSQITTAEAAPPVAAPAPSAPGAPSEEAVPSVTSAPPAAQPVPTYWLVEFPYFIDGMEATGPGSKIDVSVGDKGEVVKMVWSWRSTSPLGADNIISEQQAFQALTQGKGSIELPLDCRQVVVEQVQLKYWLDPPSEKQNYAVPVYEFKGQCQDKNGHTLENFTGWAPALSSK
jgi:hypothetical protein